MTKAPDTIGELMTRDVVTVAREDQVGTALRTMIDHDIGSVVVADGETAVGMFTERDVSRRILDDPGLIYRAVGEVMSAPVVTAATGEEVVFVFERMNANGIRRLPVVEGGRLVGIVTERDLLRWVGQVAKE